jgi:hypothetical protein
MLLNLWIAVLYGKSDQNVQRNIKYISTGNLTVFDGFCEANKKHYLYFILYCVT